MRKIWLAVVMCLTLPVATWAITITDVSVMIGPDSYSAGWTFPVSLSFGQDLVLTQTAGYNFDTSDSAVGTPVITIKSDNGYVSQFSDTQGVLNLAGLDNETTDANEAQRYSLVFVGPGYDVYLGYADNVHTGLCGAYAASLGLAESSTCFPEPGSFATATVFEGAGGPSPESLHLIQTNPNHCGDNDCYDAGVIRIVATDATPVPEPASVGLLGIGLFGIGALIRKRRS